MKRTAGTSSPSLPSPSSEGLAPAEKKHASLLSAWLDSVSNLFNSPPPDLDCTSILQEIPIQELTPYQHFDPMTYQRNLLYVDDSFSLFLLCFNPTQGTPLHNHGDGNKGWMRVVHGDVLVTLYGEETAEGHRPVTKAQVIRQGSCFKIIDGKAKHHVQNINLSCQAVVCALYSPAMVDCANVPVSYVPIAGHCSTPLKMRGPSQVYTSFERLASRINQMLLNKRPICDIQAMLNSIRLNPKEYQSYAHWGDNRYTRNLVGYDKRFTLLLLCWDTSQESPIHDHAGSSCFLKLLQGSLHEVRYDASVPGLLQVKSVDRMKKEQCGYIDDTQGVHKMVNPSTEEGAISLHVYIPPYTQSNIFNLCTGEKELVAYEKTLGTDDKPFDSFPLEAGKIVKPSELSTKLNAVFAGPTGGRQEKISAILDSIHFVPGAWADLLHFSEFEYTRILLCLTEDYSLVVNCWNPSQRTPMHSHATPGGGAEDEGIAVWARALLGKLDLQCYDTQGQDVISQMSFLPTENSVMLPHAKLQRHVALNPSDTEKAITIHVYSPPLVELSYDDLKHGRSGSLPVVYCRSVAEETTKNLDITLPQRINFSNFHGLISVLMEKIVDGGVTPQMVTEVKNVLRSFQLHPQEIEQYMRLDAKSYTRRLIAQHQNFSVYLLCWVPGQGSKIHDHGTSTSWCKILRGSLKDQQFSRPETSQEKPYALSEHVLQENDVCVTPPMQLHRTFAQGEDHCAVSLHIFASPLCKCTVFDDNGGGAETCDANALFIDKKN